ncbi:MAG: OmpA family protein [Verrucomicrobiae bacterium]|nr:OmpA family protein [Verrucomicrobiae bacterium]
MRFLLIVILFCAALAGSTFLAKVGLRNSVEKEMQVQSLAVLEEAGFGGVEVTFDHLDAALSGYVDRPEDLPRVVELLKEKVPAAYWPEPGECHISVRPTLPPRLKVTRAAEETNVRIEGTLAAGDEAVRNLLGSRLHVLSGVDTVDNAVELDAMVLPFTKMAEFASLASGLLSHPGAVTVALEEGKLSVSGTLPNEGLKKGLLELASATGAEKVEDGVSVKVPDTFLRASELRVTRNRFGVTLSGVFPAGVEREPLLQVVRGAIKDLVVTDRIEGDPACAPALWQGRLEALLPVMLGNLDGEMTAEFSESRIRVSGTTGNDASRAAVLAQLEPFRVADPPLDLLIEIEVAEGRVSPDSIEWTAVFEGGLLILEGQLPGTGTAEEIETLLKERLPEVSLKNETRPMEGEAAEKLGDALPEFFVESLARVSTAKLQMKGGVLDLEGRTIALPDRQIIENLAVNAMPAEIRIQNRLLHADQPFPKPELLPEERTRLGEAMKAHPVYFEKGSDIVSGEERSKVSAVAEALATAGGEVELVVTGYSDNIGNSASNKELSLRRAGHVKDELVKLGIAEASMTLDAVEEDVSSIPRSERWKSRRVEVTLKPLTPAETKP